MKQIALALISLLMFSGCNRYEVSLLKTLLVSDVFKKHNDASIAYEGYAFDALINGVPVVEISNREKIESLKGYRDIASVRWQLFRPIKSSKLINIDIKRKRIKEHDIGKLDAKGYEVNYHALSDVIINTELVMREEKSILINGLPLMVREHVTQRLPVGNYVLSITAHGSENWDRKEVYVEIREEDNASKFL